MLSKWTLENIQDLPSILLEQVNAEMKLLLIGIQTDRSELWDAKQQPDRIKLKLIQILKVLTKDKETVIDFWMKVIQ